MQTLSTLTISPSRPYVTTLKAMKFEKDFPALPMEDFQNHYILVFDSISLQDAAEQLHSPGIREESLRLKLVFPFPVEQVTERLVLGGRQTYFQIDKFGTVRYFFLSFQVPIKNFGSQWYCLCFFYFVFLQPSIARKIGQWVMSYWKPENILQSRRFKFFKNVVQHIKLVYGTLLNQHLYACRSSILFF